MPALRNSVVFAALLGAGAGRVVQTHVPLRAATPPAVHFAAPARSARVVAVESPGLRVVSASGGVDVAPLRGVAEKVVEALDLSDGVTPELGNFGAQFAWAHVSPVFKEIVAAKNVGAVTVWLNAAAAGAQDDAGYLSAAIMGDFADAVCASAEDLPAAVLRAQREAVRKAAEEEARERRALERERAEEELFRPVAWDATAEEAPEDPLSPFATPQEETPIWSSDALAGPWTTPEPAPAAAASGQPQQQKFCMECGQQLPGAAKFCSKCGAPQEQ